MPAKQSLNLIHLLSEFITQCMPKYGHKLQKLEIVAKIVYFDLESVYKYAGIFPYFISYNFRPLSLV